MATKRSCSSCDVRRARLGGRVPRIVEQPFEPERAARRLPVPVLVEHVEAQPAGVGGAERPDEHGAAERLTGRVRLGLDAARRGGDEVDAERPHRGAEQRHVDDRRFAGARELHQRAADAAREVRAARRVAERAARHDERRALVGEDVPEAAARPERHRVEPALVGVGTLEALARPDRVDAARVHRPDVVGAQPQLLARRRQEARDEHVGPRDQRVERGAAVVVAQVDRDAALVAVELLEEDVEALDVRDDAQLRVVPQRIARRALDLDDVGAPVGEDRGGRRHEALFRDLEHVHAVEHTHASSLPRTAAVSRADRESKTSTLGRARP